MFKVKIFTIGKVKDSWLNDAIEEYTKRLKPHMIIEWQLVKNDLQLLQGLQKEKEYICLDLNGSSFSSEEFSKWLFKQNANLTLVIGGSDGLDPNITQKAIARLSFSKMTFTHQMMRLILLEQLYRAVEIDKGSEYHK